MFIFACKYCANIFIMQEISLKYYFFSLCVAYGALWGLLEDCWIVKNRVEIMSLVQKK